MSTTLDTLKVRIEADPSALKRGLDNAVRISDDAGRKMGQAFTPVAASFSKMGLAVAGLATVAGVSSLVSLGKKALESAGNIQEMADSVGLTTKAFQEYTFAATTVGIKQEELTQGFGLFARKISDARDGNDDAVKSFRALGTEVEATVASGASVEQVFRAVATAVSKIEDPAKRTAVSLEMFGRGGRKFTNLMAEGAAGLDRFAQEAQRVGAVLAGDTIAKADKAADEIAKLDLQFQRLGENLAVQTVPILERALNIINRIIAPRQGIQAGDKLDQFRKEIAALPEGSPLRAQLEENLNKALSQDSSNIRDALLAGNVGTGKAAGATLTGDADVKRNAAAEKFIDQLRAVRDGLELTEAAQLRLRLETEVDEQGVRKFTDSQIEQAVAVQEMTDAKRRQLDLTKMELAAQQAVTDQERAATDAMRDKALAQSEILYNIEFREIPDQESLIRALGEGSMAYAEQVEYLRILNQLKATGGNVDDVAIERARELAKRNVEVNRQLERQTEATRELEHFADRAFDRIGDAMTRMAVEGGDAWKDWRNIAQGVISEVMQELVKLAMLNPLKNAIFGSNNPTLGDVGGGMFGKMFGGGGGGFAPGGGGIFDDIARWWRGDASTNGGGGFVTDFSNSAGFSSVQMGFAEGGRPPVGIPSMVGERGKELFVPDVPGTIVPNHKLGQMGGQTVVHVTQNFSLGVQSTVRAEMMNMMPRIRAETVAAVSEARQRGLVPA